MPTTCTCVACQGVHRWAAKTSQTTPPATIDADHRVAPSFFAQLAGPGEKFTKSSPRIGLEQEWFEVTGRVTHVKVDRDGDLHVQLLDQNASLSTANGYLVVEVPEGEPWCAMRAQILGWTGAHFPLHVPGKGVKLALTSHPVVRVTGRAFYDAANAPHGNTTRNSRPVVGGHGFTGSIWEVHPVMRLEVVSNH